MKQIITIFLLFLISSSSLLAQKNNAFEIDSLIIEGDYALALKKANVLIEKDSINANLWMLYGKTNRLNQYYNKAIVAYEKAISLSPDNKSWMLVLAKTYKSSTNKSKAIKIYKEVLQLDSLNTAALTGLSGIYLKQAKFKQAYLIYHKLYLSDTLNSEYIRQMGYCKYRIGDNKIAFELYKKSYEINNQNLNTIYWLSNVYSNSEKYDTAISIIDHALILYPENGRLYYSRGNISYKQNHHYRSAHDYLKSTKLGYVNEHMTKKLGKSLFVIKKYDDAREFLESLIVKDTADYQICNYLGNIYNKLKDYDKALMFYRYANEIITPAPLVKASLYSGMSDSYAGKMQYYKQIEYIKKSAKQRLLVYPGITAYSHYLEIAVIYETKLNDKKMALKYYQKYWAVIKEWKFRLEHKEQVLAKINHLKEDLHFNN